MSWLHKHLGFGAQTSQALRERLKTLSFQLPSNHTPLDHLHFCVIDLETSGLDTQQDEILSIGGVKMHGKRIQIGQPFECLINQNAKLAKPAVLIHGITPESLQYGARLEDALFWLLEYLENSVCIAFHAGFDETMLKRAYKTYLAFPFAHPFIDIAQLAPAVFPDIQATSLDDWIDALHLNVYERHNACADALATAELFQLLLGHCKHPLHTYGDLLLKIKRYRDRQALYNPR